VSQASFPMNLNACQGIPTSSGLNTDRGDNISSASYTVGADTDSITAARASTSARGTSGS
jgi:hypothetical protein